MTDDFLARLSAELKKVEGFSGFTGELRYETGLMEFGLDSLHLLELMFHVEKSYGIRVEVPEAGARQIKTVGDLKDLVDKALGSKT